jgi:hypothetical protein
LPRIDFALEPSDIARTDSDGGGELSALNPATQRNPIVDVSEFNEPFEIEKLLHGVSLCLMNAKRRYRTTITRGQSTAPLLLAKTRLTLPTLIIAQDLSDRAFAYEPLADMLLCNIDGC